MADVFDKAKRSWVMSRIRSKNTKPERLLFVCAKRLWALGYRYHKHPKNVPGKPELAFPRQKIAVFLDGEFWHGKDLERFKLRHPSGYWYEKIRRNIERDTEINAKLHQAGWKVIRIWAKDFLKSPNECIEQFFQQLRS